MHSTRRKQLIMGLLLGLVLVLAACGGNGGLNEADFDAENEEGALAAPEVDMPGQAPSGAAGETSDGDAETQEPEEAGEPEPIDPAQVEYTVPENDYGAVEVVAEPASVAVLVNKKYALPADYVPDDLVEPDVPFIFEEKLEKRKLRKEAAEALEALFAAAKEDGILLAGVSGYRSYNTQKGLYNYYVNRDGREAADRYSARPGHSEHSTGLAMDVSGIDGKCAATDCFGETPEAAWLAENAYDYGFIIRYPEGKEDITGYKYEPWHLRYVGVDIAREIRDLGLTLEEYTAMREAIAALSNGASGTDASAEPEPAGRLPRQEDDRTSEAGAAAEDETGPGAPEGDAAAKDSSKDGADRTVSDGEEPVADVSDGDEPVDGAHVDRAEKSARDASAPGGEAGAGPDREAPGHGGE